MNEFRCRKSVFDDELPSCRCVCILYCIQFICIVIYTNRMQYSYTKMDIGYVKLILLWNLLICYIQTIYSFIVSGFLTVHVGTYTTAPTHDCWLLCFVFTAEYAFDWVLAEAVPACMIIPSLRPRRRVCFIFRRMQ